MTMIIVTTVVVVAILIPLPLLWQIKLLIIVTILMMAVYAICMHGLRILPWSLVALEINPKNELNLQCLNGRQMLNVKVSEESIATQYLVILRYKPHDTYKLQGLFSRHLVILPDAIEANAFRRLRVWLRWGTLRK